MSRKKEFNTYSITEFNRGKAGVIFKDVKKSGKAYIFKNNKPVAVVLSVKEYEKMIEQIEDLEDFIITADRVYFHKSSGKTYTWEEMLKMHNITQEDLDKIEADEIE